MAADAPGVLVGTRRECPLVVGVGEHGHFFASAVAAVPARDAARHGARGRRHRHADARRAAGSTAPSGRRSTSASSTRRPRAAPSTRSCARRSPTSRRRSRARCSTPAPPAWTRSGLRDARSLRIVACGTSYNAGLVAQHLIEHWAGLPVEVEVASEYRYRTPLTGAGDLVLGITQSGETADTLAAMRAARERGALVLALTNVEGTAATREADVTLFTRAGLEVGVAATKTFTGTGRRAGAFAVRLGIARRHLSPEEADAIVQDLARLPT
jgi:glucosamine--fructose-6-phosphate aminotransferase (isomerizing)